MYVKIYSFFYITANFHDDQSRVLVIPVQFFKIFYIDTHNFARHKETLNFFKIKLFLLCIELGFRILSFRKKTKRIYTY